MRAPGLRKEALQPDPAAQCARPLLGTVGWAGKAALGADQLQCMYLGWRAQEGEEWAGNGESMDGEGEEWAGSGEVCAVLTGEDVSKLSEIGSLPHRKECSEVMDPSPEEIIANNGLGGSTAGGELGLSTRNNEEFGALENSPRSSHS